VRGRLAHIAILPREWFARDTTTVARELIGCVLAVDEGTDRAVQARIVETEAYLGTRDPASHAFRGPTPRASIMFGAPGHLYVYLSYGMHHCANLVTEPDGVAGAVLLRAASIEQGVEAVRERRGQAARQDALLRGPGNLCRGLALTLSDNGLDVCDPAARVHLVARGVTPALTVTNRVGLTVAAERPLRFLWSGHPAVSAPATRRPAVPTSIKKKGAGSSRPPVH
jgi:DNA-3-methyladenine glycosylase